MCSPVHAQDSDSLRVQISRIENSIQPTLQIEGDTIPNYNIEERMKELGIPGVSVAILKDGTVLWAKGYGVADSSENRKVTTETLFLAGSISKPVAALRAHQLAEKGVINLDTNVNHYLSTWKLPENKFTSKEKVTIRRILNHTAGLTVWGFPGYDKGDTIPSVPDVLDGKGNTDSVRVYKTPGESWQYSGGGYTIMQLLITDTEGKSFPEIMQSNVLNPLGMTESTFENPLPEQYHSIAATGYRMDGSEVEGKWPIYPEMAAAGLWTKPSQLILWAKEIQEIQQSQKDGLLKVQTVNDMLKPGIGDWGLGPSVNEHFYGHGGADEGFRADLKVWKEYPMAVVIMVNSDNGSIIQEIMMSIAQEYNLPGVEPLKRSVQIQTEKQLERFVGKYVFDGDYVYNINIKENGLLFTSDFLSQPIFMLPESDNTFFSNDDGTYFKFKLENNQASGFEVRGYEAIRLKD